MPIYRIYGQPKIKAEAGETSSDAQAYFDRLIRLIPADVIAAYLAIRGFWMPNDPTTHTEDPLADLVLNWFLPIGGIIITLLIRILGSSKKLWEFRTIQWKTVFISTIAFLIWVFAIQDSVFDMRFDPRIAPSILVLFTAVVPKIQKGDQA